MELCTKYMRKWALPLSCSKCNCKVICNTNKRSVLLITYHFNNVDLEWVETFKYLGLIIDHKLN